VKSEQKREVKEMRIRLGVNVAVQEIDLLDQLLLAIKSGLFQHKTRCKQTRWKRNWTRNGRQISNLEGNPSENIDESQEK
jgi:hypothetical protein